MTYHVLGAYIRSDDPRPVEPARPLHLDREVWEDTPEYLAYWQAERAWRDRLYARAAAAQWPARVALYEALHGTLPGPWYWRLWNRAWLELGWWRHRRTVAACVAGEGHRVGDWSGCPPKHSDTPATSSGRTK